MNDATNFLNLGVKRLLDGSAARLNRLHGSGWNRIIAGRSGERGREMFHCSSHKGSYCVKSGNVWIFHETRGRWLDAAHWASLHWVLLIKEPFLSSFFSSLPFPSLRSLWAGAKRINDCKHYKQRCLSAGCVGRMRTVSLSHSTITTPTITCTFMDHFLIICCNYCHN